MLQKFLQHISAGKRRIPRQHEIESTPKRIDVAANVRKTRIASLFRRDVVERPEHNAALGQIFYFRRKNTRKPHIDKFNAFLGRNNNIRRLDVAVRYVMRRGVRQRGRRL